MQDMSIVSICATYLDVDAVWFQLPLLFICIISLIIFPLEHSDLWMIISLS